MRAAGGRFFEEGSLKGPLKKAFEGRLCKGSSLTEGCLKGSSLEGGSLEGGCCTTGFRSDREACPDRLMADLSETNCMSPDHDQAIMFHGSNLEDLWWQSCNGKISRAMPHEEKGEMYDRSEGVWCAHGQEALNTPDGLS